MADQAEFEGWAVVELMGHQKEIGFVTSQAFGQAVLFRVDTPELPEREFVLTRPEYTDEGTLPVGSKVKRECSPAKSRLVAPAALYAINPCTEEFARAALERATSRRIVLLEMPAKGAIAAAAELPDEEDHSDTGGPFSDFDSDDDDDDGLDEIVAGFHEGESLAEGH